MLVITTTVRMLDWVHCTATDFGPAIALHLHPTIETCTKYMCVHDFGEQGFPHINKKAKLLKGFDTARHVLIPCQHGATTYTMLLDSYFGQYRLIFHRVVMEINDFLGTWVSDSKSHGKN